MAAPTYITEAETSFTNPNSATKVTSSINVEAGDILVGWAAVETFISTQTTTVTDSQGNTYTLAQSVEVADYCHVRIWTATAGSTGSMTVNVAKAYTSGAHLQFGGGIIVLRASDGVGVSVKTNVLSGAPTLDVTTTQANSAIVVVNGDWNATDGASSVWRANAGALTEALYFRDATFYTVYAGYHADAGAIDTYAVGLSAPTGQKYASVAVEVLGTAGGGGGTSVLLQMMQHYYG